MTPAQQSQFNTFGCVSRSLISLANSKGKAITRDAFCQQFGGIFLNPANQYGALAPSQIIDVVRALNLGTYFVSYRRYAEIDDAFNAKKRGVLISSEINLNPGATDIIRHFSLLTGIGAAGFSLLTPSQDGNDYPLNFSSQDWDGKLCHGIVIY